MAYSSSAAKAMVDAPPPSNSVQGQGAITNRSPISTGKIGGEKIGEEKELDTNGEVLRGKAPTGSRPWRFHCSDGSAIGLRAERRAGKEEEEEEDDDDDDGVPILPIAHYGPPRRGDARGLRALGVKTALDGTDTAVFQGKQIMCRYLVIVETRFSFRQHADGEDEEIEGSPALPGGPEHVTEEMVEADGGEDTTMTTQEVTQPQATEVQTQVQWQPSEEY